MCVCVCTQRKQGQSPGGNEISTTAVLPDSGLDCCSGATPTVVQFSFCKQLLHVHTTTTTTHSPTPYPPYITIHLRPVVSVIVLACNFQATYLLSSERPFFLEQLQASLSSEYASSSPPAFPSLPPHLNSSLFCPQQGHLSRLPRGRDAEEGQRLGPLFQRREIVSYYRRAGDDRWITNLHPGVINNSSVIVFITNVSFFVLFFSSLKFSERHTGLLSV